MVTCGSGFPQQPNAAKCSVVAVVSPAPPPGCGHSLTPGAGRRQRILLSPDPLLCFSFFPLFFLLFFFPSCLPLPRPLTKIDPPLPPWKVGSTFTLAAFHTVEGGLDLHPGRFSWPAGPKPFPLPLHGLHRKLDSTSLFVAGFANVPNLLTPFLTPYRLFLHFSEAFAPGPDAGGVFCCHRPRAAPLRSVRPSFLPSFRCLQLPPQNPPPLARALLPSLGAVASVTILRPASPPPPPTLRSHRGRWTRPSPSQRTVGAEAPGMRLRASLNFWTAACVSSEIRRFPSCGAPAR